MTGRIIGNGRGAETNNYRLVARITGYLLLIECAMLLVPAIICASYGESDLMSFLITSGLCLLAGGGLVALTRDIRSRQLYRREGYLLTSSAWVIFSAFGMLPYMLSDHPLHISDAFFETMSGFTTTGATVIPDVESLSRGLLLWRSMTQWVGGLGIVLFMLAVLPSLNQAGSIPMFNAEITGVTHDKLHPRIRQTAKSLWIVYSTLTITMILFLWAGPMDLFDSVCHAMTTLSTGGFSTRNAGISAWNSDYAAIVITVFMFLGGANFVLIYNASKGAVRPLFHNDVIRAYTGAVVLFTLLISTMLLFNGTRGISQTLVSPAFTVASAVTSTGFSYGNYELWGYAPIVIIMFLMISGACAGSTSGGIKTDRMLAVLKSIAGQTKKTLYPSHLVNVRLNDRVVDKDTMVRIGAFTASYILIMTVATMIVCAYGINVTDSFFAVASCMGNCGLGYGFTGAEGGFHLLPSSVKWLLSGVMLLGRLEIFTVIVIFTGWFRRR